MNTKPETLLRLRQVLERIPVSRSWFLEGVKRGQYPQPIKLSPRVTVWRESDIQAFIESAGHASGATR